MNKRYLTLLLAPFAAMALMGASCTVNQAFTGLAGAPTIQIEGDSVTVVGTSEINATLQADFQVSIDATEGVTTTTWMNKIAKDAKNDPDVAIIELGTNDATCTAYVADVCPGPFDPSVVEANYQTIFNDFPSTTCVIFVTLNTHADETQGWNNEGDAVLNDYIRANFTHVVDWDAAWDPSFYDPSSSVHQNAVGSQALANLEYQAAQSCLTS